MLLVMLSHSITPAVNATTLTHPCLVAVFSVLDVLRSEARVMEGLRSLLVETPYIHDILKLNVQPSDSDYAVDIRNSAICVRICVFISGSHHTLNNKLGICKKCCC